jgi:hypothetical protein
MDMRFGTWNVKGLYTGSLKTVARELKKCKNQLAQDRNPWLALANTVMNLQILAPRS